MLTTKANQSRITLPAIQKQASPNPLGRGYHKALINQLEHQLKDKSDNDIKAINHRKALILINRTLTTHKVDKIAIYAKDIVRDHSDESNKPIIPDIDLILINYGNINQVKPSDEPKQPVDMIDVIDVKDDNV